MSSLRILRENARYELRELEKQFDAALPLKTKNKAFKLFCTLLHQVAYVDILEDANFTNYANNLTRSAENWLHHLQQNNSDKKTVPASFLLPLFGAMAIGSEDLVNALASNSSVQQIQPEYEDEFCYADLINHLVLDKADIESKLDSYEGSLGDVDATRLEVCRAIAKKDTALFLESIALLNDLFIEDMQAKANNPAVPPSELNAARYVWIEGIALIRLARTHSIDVSFDYSSIPYLAVQGKAKLSLNDCILGKTPCPIN